MAVISFVITSINALFACLHFHDILSEHPGGYHPSGALGIQPQDVYKRQMKNIPVRMISYGGSNYNISFLIREKDKKQALQNLSNVLFEKK